MSKSITRNELKSTDWLAVVTCDGLDGMGAVIGFAVGDTEADVSNIPRGELFDALELFMDCDIPDDVCVEYDTVEEFYNAYGNRMPLTYEGIRL
jgi:hypothetical protein